MGLSVVFLLVLILAGVVGFFVLARVFRAAASRNENRPNAEEDKGYQSNTGSRQAALLVGTGLAVGGILSGLGGGLAATSEFLIDSAIPGVTMGIVLGIVAYYLGARKLGSVAVVLSAVALIVGIGISQGAVPFVDRTDHNLPAVEPSQSGG
jgi:hypothetical protein